MRIALVTVLVVLSAPVALAQEHAHGGDAGMAMVLFDGPMDGRAVVDAYTHFGFALLDKDGAPVPHQNAAFTIEQDGATLFATNDTHEYDGLFSFDVRFSRIGAYTVTATSGEMMLGQFNGTVVEPVNATAATVELVATPAGPASRVVDFELAILGSDGALLDHTDAIVELRDAFDGALFSRTHFHIHDEPIRFSQGFGADTDYVAQVVAYKAFATGRSADVAAVYAEFPVAVGPLAVPALPALDATPPAALEQRGASASAGGRTLYATFDPNNQVGIGQTARIAAVIVDDANRTPVAHVDFAFTLSGPRGPVFASESLHEYDGVFEYLFAPDAPGVYDGTLVARDGENELTVPVRLLVVPQLVALGGAPGPADIRVEGLDGLVASEPATLTFMASTAGGPAAHSEVDVTLFQEGEAPLYQFKLHTHDSGLTSAEVVLPREGAWKLRIDGLSTVPEPVLFSPALFSFEVAQGIAPLLGETEAAAEQAARVPTTSMALGALVVVAVAACVRRP